jgi:hypothetical protein
MPDLITIDGVAVDIDDPCAVARALRKVELKVITGGGVVMTKFGDDEVRFSDSKESRLRLQELIANYERACATKTGTRIRYAKRLRFTR